MYFHHSPGPAHRRSPISHERGSRVFFVWCVLKPPPRFIEHGSNLKSPAALFTRSEHRDRLFFSADLCCFQRIFSLNNLCTYRHRLRRRPPPTLVTSPAAPRMYRSIVAIEVSYFSYIRSLHRWFSTMSSISQLVFFSFLFLHVCLIGAWPSRRGRSSSVGCRKSTWSWGPSMPIVWAISWRMS